MNEIPTLSPEAAPELNPALDGEAFRATFSHTGRVHIADVLSRASAERIYHCLREETPWSFLVYKDGKSADLTNLTHSDRARLAAGSWEYARDHFAFCYDHHHLSYGLEPYLQARHYYARVVEFLNSPAFISFMRRMTGMDGIAYTEAHATLYRPGDFLTAHNDHLPGKNRLAAYVLNMTPDWRADWAGLCSSSMRTRRRRSAVLRPSTRSTCSACRRRIGWTGRHRMGACAIPSPVGFTRCRQGFLF